MPSQSNSSNNNSNEPPGDNKLQQMMNNCLQSTGLCCFKVSKNTNIQILEARITARKKKFGVDYINLIHKQAPDSHLKKCLKDALDEIAEFQEDIEDNYDRIDDKTKTVRESIADNNNNNSNSTKTKTKTKKNGPEDTPEPPPPPPISARPNNGTVEKNGGSNKKNKPSSRSGSNKPSSRSSNKSASSPRQSPKSPRGRKKAPGVLNSGGRRNSKSNIGAGAKIPDEFKDADPSKWRCREYNFSGQSTYAEKGKEETIKGNLSKGLQKFKSNPEKFTALAYQSDMKDWPVDQQQYMLVHRHGTVGWKPKGVSPTGWMTVHVNEYERLVPFKDNALPKKFRDRHTDAMTFQGKKLHLAKNPPILPGRGMGCGDVPGLKIIGDVDPSDIFQGSVGDCWLLSGISAVAEFDGAIKKLFRKTPDLDKMPWDGKSGGGRPTGNTYTITLWDLPTWKEVDIVIDERLPAHYNGGGGLLAGKPSEDGELWACYLEKALAVHCGGWDKIVGGQCTHAWALLTGCKEQYTMKRNPATKKWRCFAKLNPKTREWARHENSPHDCPNTTWRVGWPDVGGGGSRDLELDDEEMFLRLYAWDRENFIVGAGTSGKSDKQSTGGMVDNHAYSVIESVDNVAGTDIDLLKVRNPWGNGEIEDGEFDDDGPGWDEYPQIKKALNPVVADDGIFWVTKAEFFEFFETIYLSASNMTEFLED